MSDDSLSHRRREDLQDIVTSRSRRSRRPSTAPSKAVEKLTSETASLISASLALPDLTAIAVQLVKNALDADCSKVNLQIDLSTWTISCFDDGTGFSDLSLEVLASRCTKPIDSAGPCFPQRTTHAVRYGRRGSSLTSAAHVGILHIESGTAERRRSLLQRGHETLHRGSTSGTSQLVFRSISRESSDTPTRSSSRMLTSVTVRDVFAVLPVRRAALSTVSARKKALDQVRRAISTVALREPSVHINVMADHPQRSLNPAAQARGEGVFQQISSKELLSIARSNSLVHRFSAVYGDVIDPPNILDVSGIAPLPAACGAAFLRLTGFVSVTMNPSASRRHIYIAKEQVGTDGDLRAFFMETGLDRVLVPSTLLSSDTTDHQYSAPITTESQIRDVYGTIDSLCTRGGIVASATPATHVKGARREAYPVYVLDVIIERTVGYTSQTTDLTRPSVESLRQIVARLLIDSVRASLCQRDSTSTVFAKDGACTDVKGAGESARVAFEAAFSSGLHQRGPKRIKTRRDAEKASHSISKDQLIEIVADGEDAAVPTGMMRWVDETSGRSYFINQRTGNSFPVERWAQGRADPTSLEYSGPRRLLSRHGFPSRDRLGRSTTPSLSPEPDVGWLEERTQLTWFETALGNRPGTFRYRLPNELPVPQLAKPAKHAPEEYVQKSLGHHSSIENKNQQDASLLRRKSTLEAKTPSPQKRAAETRRLNSMPLSASQSRSNYFTPSHGHSQCGSELSDDGLDQLENGIARLTPQGLAESVVVAHVDCKFVLVNMDDGNGSRILACIDQHAADERVRVEEFLQTYLLQWAHKEVQVHPLPQPRIVELTLVEAKAMSEDAADCEPDAGLLASLGRWGFQVETVTLAELQGNDARQRQMCASVSAVPAILKDRLTSSKDEGLLEEVLRDIIVRWSDGIRPPQDPEAVVSTAWVAHVRHLPPRLLELINSKACRGAIMFNDQLSLKECEELVRKLSKTCFPFHCAHGRPSVSPLCGIAQATAVLQGSTDDAAVRWEGLEAL